MTTASFTTNATGSSHPDRIRVLVLETDQTFESTSERKGTFGDIFHSLFSKAGQDHEPPLKLETVMKFVVEPEGGKIPDVADVGEIDAVLITGSKYDAHGDDEWIWKLVQWIRCKSTLRFAPSVHMRAPKTQVLSGLTFYFILYK